MTPRWYHPPSSKCFYTDIFFFRYIYYWNLTVYCKYILCLQLYIYLYWALSIRVHMLPMVYEAFINILIFIYINLPLLINLYQYQDTVISNSTVSISWTKMDKLVLDFIIKLYYRGFVECISPLKAMFGYVACWSTYVNKIIGWLVACGKLKACIVWLSLMGCLSVEVSITIWNRIYAATIW